MGVLWLNDKGQVNLPPSSELPISERILILIISVLTVVCGLQQWKIRRQDAVLLRYHDDQKLQQLSDRLQASKEEVKDALQKLEEDER